MTAKTGHIVFVNDFGTPIVIVVVVVDDGSEERLKVGYEEERDLMLLFNVGEFKFAIVGVRVNNLLWGCLMQKGT